MSKRILLFAAAATLALAVAAPLAAAGFDVVTAAYAQASPLALFTCASLAAWVIAPAVAFVARHVKQALAMSLQPGGRSPAIALIAAKARKLAAMARKQVTVTGSWQLCPST